MVSHSFRHNTLARPLRTLGWATAYVAVMMAGTALLMGLFSGAGSDSLAGLESRPLAATELVMQRATERALVSPDTAIVANMDLK